MRNDEDQNNQQEQSSQERQPDPRPDYRRLIDTERRSIDPDRKPFQTEDFRGPKEEK